MISRVTINGNNFDCQNLGDIEFDYAQSSEDGCFQTIVEMGTKLVFVGDDFESIRTLTSDICKKNIVIIYEYCDGSEVEAFEGYFTRTDCEFNYDRCLVKVDIVNNTKYECLIKSYENDYNILQTPNPQDLDYTLFRSFEFTSIIPGQLAPTGYGLVGQWSENSLDPQDPDYVVSAYARVVEVSGCIAGVPEAPDNDPNWYLIDDNCALNGTAKWGRPAVVGVDCASFNSIIVGDPVSYVPGNTGQASPPPASVVDPLFFGFHYIDLGPVNNYNIQAGTYSFYIPRADLLPPNPFNVDNGRKLEDVIQYLLDQQECGLTFKSSFFGTSGFKNDPNPVTNVSPNPMEGLLIFQKSDVADPSASENARIAEINLATLVNDLNILFNVHWQVDEDTNKFIIEHWSTLNNIPVGIDLTVDPLKEYADNNNVETFNKAEIPDREEFQCAVKSNDVDFTGLNITYNTDCSGTSTKKYQTQQICTDWEQVFLNDEFITEGLMLVQPRSLSVGDVNAEEGRVTGVFKPNAPLGFGATLPDYYTYNRPNTTGIINNVLTLFDSTKRIRIFAPVTVPYCCSIQDPTILVKSNLGDGVIEEGIYNPRKQTLTLNLISEL